MQKNIWLKLLVCLAVLVIFGAVGVYPIIANSYGITSPSVLMNQQLKLGLDHDGEGARRVLELQEAFTQQQVRRRRHRKELGEALYDAEHRRVDECQARLTTP